MVKLSPRPRVPVSVLSMKVAISSPLLGGRPWCRARYAAVLGEELRAPHVVILDALREADGRADFENAEERCVVLEDHRWLTGGGLALAGVALVGLLGRGDEFVRVQALGLGVRPERRPLPLGERHQAASAAIRRASSRSCFGSILVGFAGCLAACAAWSPLILPSRTAGPMAPFCSGVRAGPPWLMFRDATISLSLELLVMFSRKRSKAPASSRISGFIRFTSASIGRSPRFHSCVRISSSFSRSVREARSPKSSSSVASSGIGASLSADSIFRTSN